MIEFAECARAADVASPPLTETGNQPQRACPLCGGFERKGLFQRDGWNVVECSRCSMVFIGNPPPAYNAQAAEHDWMAEHTKEASRRKESRPVLMFFSRLMRPLRGDTTSRQLAHALHWRREGKLLDLGCGDGRFLAMAAGRFEVMGVELSASAAASARARVPDARIVAGAVTEASVPEGAFDIVTQFSYLEHEWDPAAALRVAHRALKSGGVLVVKTPNYASWNRRVMGEEWCGIHIPSHCNYFTPATLGRMLRQAGFEPLPRPLPDRLPTSDTLWMAARRS
jgi:SAM-dependent methyltransferase